MRRRRSRKNHSSDSDDISGRKPSAKISMGFRVNVSMTTTDNRHFPLAPPPKPLPPLSSRSKQKSSYNKSVYLNKLEPPPSLPPSIFGPNGTLMRYSPHIYNNYRRRTNGTRRYSYDNRRQNTSNHHYRTAYQPQIATATLPSYTQLKNQSSTFWPPPTAHYNPNIPIGYNIPVSTTSSRHSEGAVKSKRQRSTLKNHRRKNRRRHVSCSTCSTSTTSSTSSYSSSCSSCVSYSQQSSSQSSSKSSQSDRTHRRHHRKVKKTKRIIYKRERRHRNRRKPSCQAPSADSSNCCEFENPCDNSNNKDEVSEQSNLLKYQTEDKADTVKSNCSLDNCEIKQGKCSEEYDDEDDEDLRELAEKKRILLEQLAQLDSQIDSPNEVGDIDDNQPLSSTAK